jgi:hypothetical protein
LTLTDHNKLKQGYYRSLDLAVVRSHLCLFVIYSFILGPASCTRHIYLSLSIYLFINAHVSTIDIA